MKNKFAIIISICILLHSLIFGLGFPLITNYTTNDLLISFFIGTIFNFIILNIFTKDNTTSFISNIVSILIIILYFTILETYITSFYLINTPNYVINLCVLLIIIYVTNLGRKVIYRVSSFIFIINIISFIIVSLFLFYQVDINNFKPILSTNINHILMGSISYSLITITPYLHIKKETNRKTLNLSLLISSLLTFMVFFLTLGILGPTLIKLYRYPEYMVLKKITIFNTLSNMENIFSFIWANEIIISLIFYLNYLKENFNKKQYLILLIGLGIFSIMNHYYIINLINNYILIILIIIFILLIISKKFFKYLPGFK